jgi:uncharacterized membrane protein YkoI
MTETKGTQTTYTKPLAMTWTGILALALLTGCASAEPEANGAPADGAATATTAPAENSPAASSPAAGDDDGQDTSSAPSTTGNASTASGDDPVIAAIKAVYAEHSGAIIVEVSREDDDSRHDVEAVIGNELRDFDVLADGTVREDIDDDDVDQDDVQKAKEATVTAEDAVEAALQGRDGQTIDDMELEREDGALRWEIGLDRANGSDGDELRVDAATGAVTADN